MKSYIGSKIIQAIEMNEFSFLSEEKGKRIDIKEDRQGYKVIYPDGYISWSPKEVFETAYREITDGEKKLIDLCVIR